jgi:hypothetical protein
MLVLLVVDCDFENESGFELVRAARRGAGQNYYLGSLL